ncbi:MAG: site-specific integrase [Cyanobacteriota bacterium]|nr:site-specific integrase [Cyanobacteriota bacterium]
MSNDKGRIRLKVRGKDLASQSIALPFDWSPDQVADALLLINRSYVAWRDGRVTLQAAVKEAMGCSDKQAHLTAKDWQSIATSFRGSLQNGRNEIKDSTWRDNYAPYLNEALRLLRMQGGPADGYELLKRTLEKWKGKPSSRAACCLALRNLMDYAVARHGMPPTWRIERSSIQELRGRSAERRTKATLTDQELLDLIAAIDDRNRGWSNALRILTLYGLRPTELQWITPRRTESGMLGMWCAYRKVSGANKTEPRWLQSLPLEDRMGELVSWNLAGAMEAGLLELPAGRDGQQRKLNGHYIQQFLVRQPEWKALQSKYANKGLWLRAYSFRDSYSVRAHRMGIETAQICRAMGHGLQAHSRAYESATDATTAQAFSKAITQKHLTRKEHEAK